MSNSNSNSNSNQGHMQSSFLQWTSQQRSDLEDLLHVVEVVPEPDDVEVLRGLAQKTIQHLNEYQQSRSVDGDALSIYKPSWCTSFENFLFWVGGLKPSIYIRLLFSISGIGSEKVDLDLSKLVIGERINGRKKVVECSDVQVKLIKGVHAQTVLSEQQISSRLANLQARTNTSWEQDVGRAVDAHRVALNGIVVDADELRVKVLKELLQILTPLQGIHFLVAVNRLHLSIHEWGSSNTIIN
ncbi:hypothetical protein QVD17_04807 [Tagetes erecta]|uniref:DOG1 domain-containing protein n=1 Tax=Tagetes erecta TaxID=13708 RepID=A0AAD8PA17_TARER|nr:hypothetical protein QVD17_04807 [Tagetes erecta]